MRIFPQRPKTHKPAPKETVSMSVTEYSELYGSRELPRTGDIVFYPPYGKQYFDGARSVSYRVTSMDGAFIRLKRVRNSDGKD